MPNSEEWKIIKKDPKRYAKVKKWTKKYFAEAREEASVIKRKKGCKRCGLKDAICLDFHHKKRSEKTMSIAHAFRNKSKENRNKLKIELKKCIILCKNCHAIEEEKLRLCKN